VTGFGLFSSGAKAGVDPHALLWPITLVCLSLALSTYAMTPSAGRLNVNDLVAVRLYFERRVFFRGIAIFIAESRPLQTSMRRGAPPRNGEVSPSNASFSRGFIFKVPFVDQFAATFRAFTSRPVMAVQWVMIVRMSRSGLPGTPGSYNVRDASMWL
jgi:hypothetical protein